MPREFARKHRVAAELQRLMNELLRAEVKDPRLGGVTVNEVELSGDLGVAKVYYGTLDPDDDPKEAQAAFKKAAGFLRSRVSQSLQLRRVPELHFVRDLSARHGFELSRLIDELHVDPGGEVGDEEAGGEVGDEEAGGRDDEPTDSSKG